MRPISACSLVAGLVVVVAVAAVGAVLAAVVAEKGMSHSVTFLFFHILQIMEIG